MGVRIANDTTEDFWLLCQMADKFIEAAPYKDLIQKTSVYKVIAGFLSEPNKVLFLNDDIGFIAGMITPFIFSGKPMAIEMGWWVSPDERNKKAGKELLDAFEQWAKDKGAESITLVCLDANVGAYYEKRGYTLYEQSYMKTIPHNSSEKEIKCQQSQAS